MSEPRPPILTDMKRNIRKRCGFGCVVCGFPFYDYEHMFGFKRQHIESEITLLCDRCHREKTSGLLPLDVLREADRNPFNKRAGFSSSYPFRYSGNSCVLRMGNCFFTNNGFANGTLFIAIAIDRVPMVAFTHDQDHLFLTLLVTDDKNTPVLWIEENELRYSISPWDITLIGRNLVLREKVRDILIDIVFDPPNGITIRRGRLIMNGLEIHITPAQIGLANTFVYVSGLRFDGGGIMYGDKIDGLLGLHFPVPVANRVPVDRSIIQEHMKSMKSQMEKDYAAINKAKTEPGGKKKSRKKRKQEKQDEYTKGEKPIDPV